MLLRLRFAIAFLFLGIGVFLLTGDLYASWQAFLQDCPNQDVLSWDANLRFRTVVDLYDEIQKGNYFLPVYYTLWSPTWPALRSFLALIVFFLNGSGPNTVHDVFISFGFYLLLFPSLLWVAVDLTRDLLRGSIVWLFVSFLILHSRQLTLYALSSMLETQGMFFMLWSMYFLYKIYEQERMRRFFQWEDRQNRPPFKRRWFWGLLLSTQGLFHTKYPYGLMLFIALFVYEFAREPLRLLSFASIAGKNHYAGKRRVFLYAFVFLGLAFLSLMFLSKIQLSPLSPSSKSMRNLLWIVSLAFFVDLNLYIYKFRREFSRFFDSAFNQIYVAALLPIAFWLLLHPDRLGSILGTQQHKQEASRSFTMSLLLDVFEHTSPFYLLLIAAAFGMLLYLWMLGRELPWRRGLVFLLRHPLVALLSFLFIQFLTLEKLTANKQLRHIYHLLPSLLLVLGVVIIRLPHLLGLSIGRIRPSFFVLSRLGYLALPLSLLVFLNPPKQSPNQNESIKEMLLSAFSGKSYVQGRWLCFTDYNKDLFTSVRSLITSVPQDKDYILFNFLHKLPPLDARRVFATDFDVLLRMHLLNKGRHVRNYNSFPPFDWKDYQNTIILFPDCNKQKERKAFEQIFRQALEKNKIKQGLPTFLVHSALSPMCLQIQSIKFLNNKPLQNL